MRALPPYSQQAKRHLSDTAVDVRHAFRTATEPDVLVFETLPTILGSKPFSATGSVGEDQAFGYANTLANVVRELRAAYPDLLERVRAQLAEATAVAGDLDAVVSLLRGQAANLQGRVLEPRLRAFVTALARPLDGQDWLENVAMVVAEGQAPRVWNDDVAERFPLLVSELGGALMRTQALLYGRLAASHEAFDTRRLTVTAPDGAETSEVLTLSPAEAKVADEHLDQALQALRLALGSESSARRTLLARLLMPGPDVVDLRANESLAQES